MGRGHLGLGLGRVKVWQESQYTAVIVSLDVSLVPMPLLLPSPSSPFPIPLDSLRSRCLFAHPFPRCLVLQLQIDPTSVMCDAQNPGPPKAV